MKLKEYYEDFAHILEYGGDSIFSKEKKIQLEGVTLSGFEIDTFENVIEEIEGLSAYEQMAHLMYNLPSGEDILSAIIDREIEYFIADKKLFSRFEDLIKERFDNLTKENTEHKTSTLQKEILSNPGVVNYIEAKLNHNTFMQKERPFKGKEFIDEVYKRYFSHEFANFLTDELIKDESNKYEFAKTQITNVETPELALDIDYDEGFFILKRNGMAYHTLARKDENEFRGVLFEDRLEKAKQWDKMYNNIKEDLTVPSNVPVLFETTVLYTHDKNFAMPAFFRAYLEDEKDLEFDVKKANIIVSLNDLNRLITREGSLSINGDAIGKNFFPEAKTSLFDNYQKVKKTYEDNTFISTDPLIRVENTKLIKDQPFLSPNLFYVKDHEQELANELFQQQTKAIKFKGKIIPTSQEEYIEDSAFKKDDKRKLKM